MKRVLFLAGILVALVPATAGASTIFNYSFVGDSAPFFSAGKLLGTVTGQIVLPDGDGTFLPTSVTVTSFTPGLTGSVNLNLTPTTWATQVGAGFTVTGGIVTAASWAAQQGPIPGYNQIRFNFSSFNAFFLDGDNVANNWNAITNDDGFAGVTYSAVSAVPEPATLLLLGTGLGAVAARRRRMKRS